LKLWRDKPNVTISRHTAQAFVKASPYGAARLFCITQTIPPSALAFWHEPSLNRFGGTGSFASHLSQANYDNHTIQELLGHSDVRTTISYTNTIYQAVKKRRLMP